MELGVDMCLTTLLLGGREQSRHVVLVDDDSVAKQRLSAAALDLEAAAQIEPDGSQVVGHDGQLEPAEATAPGLRDSLAEQGSADASTAPRCVDAHDDVAGMSGPAVRQHLDLEPTDQRL